MEPEVWQSINGGSVWISDIPTELIFVPCALWLDVETLKQWLFQAHLSVISMERRGIH